MKAMKAMKARVLRCHPDKALPANKEWATKQWLAIDEAHRVLHKLTLGMCFEGNTRMRDPNQLATFASDIFALGETICRLNQITRRRNKNLANLANLSTHYYHA